MIGHLLLRTKTKAPKNIWHAAEGISSTFGWNGDIHRYESYDLNRGPVFYEAYYPDSNEEARGNYQEKRFFDRGPVLEKTYQVPSQRVAFPENVIRLDNYQSRAEGLLQDPREDRLSPRASSQTFDIKEISNLARRAISRDLENWNAIESYLDRAKYQDPSYSRRMVAPDSVYGIEQSVRGASLPEAFKGGQDPRRQAYEEVLEDTLGSSSRIQSSVDRRIPEVMRRLTARDLDARNSLGTFASIRYQNQPPVEREAIGAASGSNLAMLKEINAMNARPIADPYPPEDIFAPRPQVINYIFSRKPIASTDDKVQAQSFAAEAKDASKEPMPRNYGDNLIQEEIKKAEEGKDVKVTSIEVSEVPKHKTRHHHGEWPKRDYSKRHQS